MQWKAKSHFNFTPMGIEVNGRSYARQAHKELLGEEKRHEGPARCGPDKSTYVR